jgi:hypothetical protein
MTLYDSDHDQALSTSEVAKAPGLRWVFSDVDSSQDGKLQADEIAKRIQAFVDDQAAMMSMVCEVFVDGQPVEGALVTLTPESFLSGMIKPASGTTDAYGTAVLKMEGQQDAGVHFGMYQIQVSKKNAGGTETLPAKYNSATELGREVSYLSRDNQSTIRLELTSR